MAILWRADRVETLEGDIEQMHLAQIEVISMENRKLKAENDRLKEELCNVVQQQTASCAQALARS